MLATRKQIAYLQDLADLAEEIRRKHPGLIPPGLYHQKWDAGMTSEKASLRIRFYQSILGRAEKALEEARNNHNTQS